jgi:hypothetical protein
MSAREPETIVAHRSSAGGCRPQPRASLRQHVRQRPRSCSNVLPAPSRRIAAPQDGGDQARVVRWVFDPTLTAPVRQRPQRAASACYSTYRIIPNFCRR